MTTEPIDLDAAQALADAATEGQWILGGTDSSGNRYIGNVIDDYVLDEVVATSGECDAEFIAQARTLVPALVAELREARSEVKDQGYFVDFAVDLMEGWKYSAEAAEATLARVRAIVDDLKRQGCLSCSSLTGGDDLADILNDAIEGGKS